MRPIDADALDIMEYREEFPSGAEDIAWNAAVRMINDYIQRVPTLSYKDLVPQGEWIWNEECECWCCSRCEASALNNYRGLSVESNFCPNCGARMKGE